MVRKVYHGNDMLKVDKTIIFIIVATTINLTLYPDKALSQSRKQCQQIEGKIQKQVQANIPSPTSPSYIVWLNRLTLVLDELQEKYPNCNISRRRQMSDSEREESRRDLERRQEKRQEEFNAEQRERDRRTNRWRTRVQCWNTGLQYDPDNNECY